MPEQTVVDATKVNEPVVETKDKVDVSKLLERIEFLEKESRNAYSSRDIAKLKTKELEGSLDIMKTDYETKLKEVGDYEKLKNQLSQKESKLVEQNNSLKKQVIALNTKALGLEHEILKPDYINLFTYNFEVDDSLNITNMEDAKKEFAKFKEANPTLFKTKNQIIPRVDQKAPSPLLQKPVSPGDKIRLGLEQKMNINKKV